MSKTKVFSKLQIVIFCLCIGLLPASCRYKPSEEKCIDIVSDIAQIVNGNYSNENTEKPLSISMTDIGRSAPSGSDLNESIEKYDTVQEYHVYLTSDQMVIVVTDSIFQQIEGYVVSDQELQGVLTIPGLGSDGDSITIVSRIDDSNIYSFRAGQ